MNVSRLSQRVLLILSLFSAIKANTQVILPSVFSDNMVLQHSKPLTFWGKASAGELVTISFAGQQGQGKANDAGDWKVILKSLAISPSPRDLIITASNTITLKNILVGEVWICSGQSNMDMTVAREDRYWCGVINEKEEVAAADYPLIRVFDTDFSPSATLQYDVKGKWEVVSPQTIGHLSAVAYFFARDVQKKMKTPIGLITTAFGASTAEAWIREEALVKDTLFKKLLENYRQKLTKYISDTAAITKYKVDHEKWKIAAAEAKAAGKDAPRGPRNPDPVRDQHNPSVLWNGMVHPLVPYAIRGALWYQGESNSPTASIYRQLMETLIVDWRQQWGQGNFPFLYVQLANIGKTVDSFAAKGGSEAIKREAQLQNLSVPNTAMAVAIDNADPDDMNNVHPKNKQEIGRRLALAALATVYGEKIPYSGPVFDKMKIEGNTIRLYFTHTNGGLVAKDGELKGFAIAGEDKKFVWGKAIIDGNTIVVSTPEIINPVAVRYGWGSNPPISLYNKENLPASPFRTDSAWK